MSESWKIFHGIFMSKYIVFALIAILILFGLPYFSKFFPTKECSQLTGNVVLKDDANYDKARLVSNFYTSKNRFPKAIVYAQNSKDVQNAIRWARCNNVQVRIRSGGHHHEGYSTGTDALVIDVSQMKEIQLDKENQIATIQPGLNNLELYTILNKNGFTHVGGTCSEVGLSGLVLSGGIGPLVRRVGLTCDTLISVDIVDANANIITATKDNEYKDLFWATCGGGGGNFGVITSMKIKVFPTSDVTWFNIGWDWDQPMDEIIAAWQDFFEQPDRNWFSHLDLWAKSFPEEELKKQPIKVLGVFFGSQEDAKKQLEPLLNIGTPASTVIESVTWDKAIQNIEASTAVFLTEKPEYKSTGAFAMEKLPEDAVRKLYEALKTSPSPLLNVLLFSMSGATADIAPTDTAYFYRQAKFFINYSSQWLKEEEDKKHKTELTALRQQLLPYTVGDYIGNPDPELKDYMKEYYGENATRLQCVKRKYDPENFFHFEQSIPPATADQKCE